MAAASGRQRLGVQQKKADGQNMNVTKKKERKKPTRVM